MQWRRGREKDLYIITTVNWVRHHGWRPVSWAFRCLVTPEILMGNVMITCQILPSNGEIQSLKPRKRQIKRGKCDWKHSREQVDIDNSQNILATAKIFFFDEILTCRHINKIPDKGLTACMGKPNNSKFISHYSTASTPQHPEWSQDKDKFWYF
jgi:hypothetical protein